MTLNKMSLHGPMYFFKSRNFDQSHPSFRGEIDQSYIDIELSYSDANGVRLIIILCFKKEIKVSIVPCGVQFSHKIQLVFNK